MENIQKPKSDPKGKAIASFVLGIGTILVIVVLTKIRSETVENFSIFILPGLFIILLIGLILGIIGLRSSKRIFAAIGIVMNIVCLLFLFLKSFLATN